MADIDPTNPTDASIVSQFPSNERTSRAAIETNFYLEHKTDNGRHQFGIGNDAARDAFTDWIAGSLFLNTKTTPATLQRVVSADPDVWEDIGVPTTILIPVGTKACFFQAAAPTNWTQDVSQNDKVFRVVSGAGGGSAGSWTLTGVTVDSHVLTITEIAAHGHNNQCGNGSNPPIAFTSSGPNNFGGGTLNDPWRTYDSEDTGGDGGHVHGLTSDGAWRPAYIDVLIATKD